MNIQDDTKKVILSKHASLCKTLAHVSRLEIVELLSKGERSVGEIADSIGLSISTTSQHLRLLKDCNVLVTRKEGRTVYYGLKHFKLFTACLLIREALLEDMKGIGEVAASVDADIRR